MKKYPIRFLSFLIFVGFLFVGLPLHPIKAALTVNYLTDQDGLPNYTVYKIFKDSRNMMWVGTVSAVSTDILSPSFTSTSPSLSMP